MVVMCDRNFNDKTVQIMVINRDEYVDRLLAKRWNGKVKIITGIRRSGKSFLLSVLYKKRLLGEGAEEDDFIEIALDRKTDIRYRNPNLLYSYIIERTKDTGRKFYVFIDEIQLSYKVMDDDTDGSAVPEEDRELLYTTFYDILNDLMARPNLDIYVTGSNSKMLSKDIVTNFRDRGSEIKVYPLSFAEYLQVAGQEKADALEEYIMYGGMPLAVLEPDEKEKRKYLQGLFSNVYIKDIVERYKRRRPVVRVHAVSGRKRGKRLIISVAVAKISFQHNVVAYAFHYDAVRL